MVLKKKYIVPGKMSEQPWEQVDFDEEWDARLGDTWRDKEAFKAYVEEAKSFRTMFAVYEVVDGS